MNNKQLVVVTREQSGLQPILIVYQLDSLVSESADLAMSPRLFQIGEPDGWDVVRIDMNKIAACCRIWILSA